MSPYCLCIFSVLKPFPDCWPSFPCTILFLPESLIGSLQCLCLKQNKSLPFCSPKLHVHQDFKRKTLSPLEKGRIMWTSNWFRASPHEPENTQGETQGHDKTLEAIIYWILLRDSLTMQTNDLGVDTLPKCPRWKAKLQKQNVMDASVTEEGGTLCHSWK